MAAGDWEPDFETYAGTKLYITATRPTTNTEAAFEAKDWNEITITSVPNYRGRTYNTATLAVVSNAHDKNKKGSYTLPPMDFGVQWLPDQQGQIIAQAALLGYAICGFAVVDQNGGVSYFSGQVSNFVESGGSSNDARAGTLSVLRQSDVIDAVTPALPVEDTTP
jgi:hypothetical protein